ncbi:MAG: phenylacetate--CoA ligase, partial [Defluviitaleaceae bacterium]|nr:phenylacetate--CoA ligase [Defluviitaleaceae bacterium]
VSQDCRFQNGLHIWEDCFIPEITDPITGSVLDCGCYGDLVITTINKEGIPLIRYKTKDICSLIADKCECGRTHIRMTKPAGRTDDMLIIRGVNVFPSQIEGVLLESGETAPHYQIIVDRIGNLDHMVVELEVSEKMFSDDIEGMEILEKKLLSKMESILGISCKIKLVEPKSLSRNDGTAKINRVIDKRKYE